MCRSACGGSIGKHCDAIYANSFSRNWVFSMGNRAIDPTAKKDEQVTLSYELFRNAERFFAAVAKDSQTLAEKPRRLTRLAMKHECGTRSRVAPMCLTCRKGTFSARA